MFFNESLAQGPSRTPWFVHVYLPEFGGSQQRDPKYLWETSEPKPLQG